MEQHHSFCRLKAHRPTLKGKVALPVVTAADQQEHPPRLAYAHLRRLQLLNLHPQLLFRLQEQHHGRALLLPAPLVREFAQDCEV